MDNLVETVSTNSNIKVYFSKDKIPFYIYRYINYYENLSI